MPRLKDLKINWIVQIFDFGNSRTKEEKYKPIKVLAELSMFRFK